VALACALWRVFAEHWRTGLHMGETYCAIGVVFMR